MIMLWVAAALACLAPFASASTDTMAGYDAPAFWTKHHVIPHSYCMESIVAEAADPAGTASSAIPCPLEAREARGGEVFAICRVSKEKIASATSALRKTARVVFEKMECPDPPDNADLAYKSRHLEEEYQALGLSSATAPGLAGLYDAEMKMLDILQRKDERARIPTFDVFISSGGRCAGPACEEFLNSRWQSSRDWQTEAGLNHDGFKPWNRKMYPACLQVPAIHVSLGIKDRSPRAADVKRDLEKLGEPYLEPDCSRSEAPIAMVLSHKALRTVEKATLDLPELKNWARTKMREANTVTDDQRPAILEREMKAVDLSRSPHLRNLALAERERVKNSAETIRRLNKGVLIIVSFEDR